MKSQPTGPSAASTSRSRSRGPCEQQRRPLIPSKKPLQPPELRSSEHGVSPRSPRSQLRPPATIRHQPRPAALLPPNPAPRAHRGAHLLEARGRLRQRHPSHGEHGTPSQPTPQPHPRPSAASGGCRGHRIPGHASWGPGGSATRRLSPWPCQLRHRRRRGAPPERRPGATGAGAMRRHQPRQATKCRPPQSERHGSNQESRSPTTLVWIQIGQQPKKHGHRANPPPCPRGRQSPC
mmetsp:Transcript_3025/g.11699  ORF Transcript_3025/g.11699 Transcript_3025/m.11699 type:complete len:236 (-) Transcript_3025:311-1018(-)